VTEAVATFSCVSILIGVEVGGCVGRVAKPLGPEGIVNPLGPMGGGLSLLGPLGGGARKGREVGTETGAGDGFFSGD
jgi:hypothetical protein